MKRRFSFGVALAAALALAGAANAQTTSHDQHGSTPAGPPADAEFVRKAAMSGMKEVRVSEHAAQSATNTEVKEFARRLVQDHTAVNERLRSVAGASNVALPAELDAMHRQEVQQLTGLSGAALDGMYMDKMVQSHQKSVQLFEAKSAGSGPLAELAKTTLPTLRDHLQMALDLQGKVGRSVEAGSTGMTATEQPATSPEAGMTATTEQPATSPATEQPATAETTTGTTETERAAPARTTEPAMPASASAYPLAILIGLGLGVLGLALRLKK